MSLLKLKHKSFSFSFFPKPLLTLIYLISVLKYVRCLHTNTMLSENLVWPLVNIKSRNGWWIKKTCLDIGHADNTVILGLRNGYQGITKISNPVPFSFCFSFWKIWNDNAFELMWSSIVTVWIHNMLDS